MLPNLYPLFADPLNDHARLHGMEVRASGHYLDFIHKTSIVRISHDHLIYGASIIQSFQHFFSAVESQAFGQYQLVDYSTSRYQTIRGWDLMPLYVPSFVEPVATTQAYLPFADIKPGNTVLDLGAYAGQTSIMFKHLAGPYGRVIALDADPMNIRAIQKNFELYSKISKNTIDLVYGAIWNHTNGLSFSSENNMGSSATEIVGADRGHNLLVPSFTLTSLAQRVGLTNIDFIKCDVEGAEACVFEDREFFARFRPRILIETHMVNGRGTADICTELLGQVGYTCRPMQTHIMAQLPMLECVPN